jgi:uncharacterized membrane protein
MAQRPPKVLPPLDGDTDSIALAINNRGETAGISGDAVGGSIAVAWDRMGTPRALLPLPGDSHSEAVGINNRGEVAGNSGASYIEASNSTAVRWDRKGAAVALPPLPGGDSSLANGINAAGEVVGISVANGKWTAVIWDRDGIPRALAPLPGASGSSGKAINNRGMVAGLSGNRAVVWSRDGTPRALAVLEGIYGYDYNLEVNGINWRGEVVGSGENVEGYLTAVIWDRDGKPRDLELPLIEAYPGEFEIVDTFGLGIDPTGEVVGYSPYGYATLWDRSGTVMILPPLESDETSRALAINNRGEIAGLSQGYDEALSQHTFTAVVWR